MTASVIQIENGTEATTNRVAVVLRINKYKTAKESRAPIPPAVSKSAKESVTPFA